ncbi:hypothetical protein IMSHALPRED_005784 [Imshaugia aleurites]|uniref:DNA2/NAM7 helicase-like C-terminal domain-containing protein n=1 Tax=Imshaugia aleurites TaxID=172621 RepID=A0A8H3FCQ3_9LECA|nr:hypothetical protein IMSHALPRED_005784 [Imshaugia aleurites]
MQAANKHADVGPALTPEQFATEFNACKIYIYIYMEIFDDSAFPNDQVYNGLLRNHPTAFEDSANKTRAKMRQISRELGVQGYKKQGSEYFLIDVKHAVSRIELNGNSLVNHANADRIIILIKSIIDVCIRPAEIRVLCYYQGQRRLLMRKIRETEWEEDIKNSLQVQTVDS